MKKWITAVGAALLIAGCGGGGDDDKVFAVSYSVSANLFGPTSASITYATSDGGTSQATVNLPFSTSISAKSGDFLYISAQGATNATAGLSTSISIDGHTFKFNSSTGAFSIATSSGTCC